MYLRFYSIYRIYEFKEVIYFKLTKENFEQVKFLFNNPINTNNKSCIDNKIYLIYSSDNLTLPNFETNSVFIYIDYELDDLFDIINLKNNYIFKNKNCKYINFKTIQNLYNNLAIDNPKFDNNLNKIEKYINLNNELIEFIDKDINPSNEVKSFCLFKNIKINKLESFETTLVDDWNNINHSNILFNFNKLKEYIIDIINNIDNYADYNDFLDYNICEYVNNTNHLKSIDIQENTLENVYYYKKQFYNSKGELMKISFMDNDVEYRHFKNKRNTSIIEENLSNEDFKKAIVIEDKNIFYLDYIYGFYNFGEFWDCIIRLIYTKNISDYQLYHLQKSRVYYIDYYFNKLNLDFPNKNENLINKNEYSDDLLFFNKIHFTNLYNTCRGNFDNHIAYRFNKIYNNTVVSDKNYILYLKRGSYGRELKNEDILINKLSNLDNFIVIDGKESLEDMINYWTNAIFVIGVHGSLFKNMIYCKKNPIFIELCPLSRSVCFLNNALFCNFLYFFITLPSDEKENVILDDDNINNLIELIDEIM